MPDSALDLATRHWNKTPLFISEEARYSTYPWLYDAAEFRDHAGERVLEIGCGTGCDLLQFAKHGALACGIDMTEEHVRLAKERVGNMAEVKLADARDIPFADGSFDYVYSHGVIHHSNEPQKMAREILRVLKPGGRFNIHLYARWSWLPAYLFYKHGFEWRNWIENSRDPVFIELYTSNKIRKLFRSAENLSFKRFQGYPGYEVIAPWLGWYVVAKGTKPAKQ